MKTCFPIHLCQPDAAKSCAACCGLYNFTDNHRSRTTARLRENCRTFTRIRGDSLQICSDHTAKMRPIYNGPDKLFETIFNCEFIGFLNKQETLVGCLLHPSRCGRECRDLSFHGAQLCDGHFCLSYYYLSLPEQQLVINCIDDWYLYGLVITDIDLVKGFFQAASDRLGESLDPQRAKSQALRPLINEFFRLKLHWPFRAPNENQFGKYLFQGEHYEQIHIAYEQIGQPRSRYHQIFLALGSSFTYADELRAAETLLERMLDQVAAIYPLVNARTP